MCQTFPKAERLTHRSKIKELFEKGAPIKAFPIRGLWLPCAFEDEVQIKVVIAVPKRKMRKAVDRNRTKRLLREAYRKHKANCLPKLNTQVALMLLFIDDKEWPLADLEQKIITLLDRLVDAQAVE